MMSILHWLRDEATAVVLLYQSAVFDTNDHGRLLDCLSPWFGTSGVVLDWFKSCLSDHIQCVKTGPLNLQKLQCVQNSLARIVTNTIKYSRITPLVVC